MGTQVVNLACHLLNSRCSWVGMESFVFPCQRKDDKLTGAALKFDSILMSCGSWLMRSQAILLTGWAHSPSGTTGNIHTVAGRQVCSALCSVGEEGKTKTTQVLPQIHYYFLEVNEIMRGWEKETFCFLLWHLSPVLARYVMRARKVPWWKTGGCGVRRKLLRKLEGRK